MVTAEQLIQRFYAELINRRRAEVAAEILSEDFRDHPGAPGVPNTRDGLVQWIARVGTSFPDLHVTVDDVVTQGDKAAARITITGRSTGPFLGRAPTGRDVTWTGIDMFRVAEGRIAERWSERDLLGLFQQLGVISEEWSRCSSRSRFSPLASGRP